MSQATIFMICINGWLYNYNFFRWFRDVLKVGSKSDSSIDLNVFDDDWRAAWWRASETGIMAKVCLNYLKHMMTSSNGNIFRVAGPLCGEFTGPRWIPLTKASDAELWYFLWSAPE